MRYLCERECEWGSGNLLWPSGVFPVGRAVVTFDLCRAASCLVSVVFSTFLTTSSLVFKVVVFGAPFSAFTSVFSFSTFSKEAVIY